MKLSQLVQSLPFLEKRNFSDREITGIAFDSQQVQRGNIFVAIPGTQIDGHQFIPHALQLGAQAIVAEQNVSTSPDIPIFRVSNSRKALSCLASHWYHNPSQELHITGITGTNGKTTISCLLDRIFTECGYKAGRIGTIGYHYQGHDYPLNHTTPESLEIHRILAEMKQQQTSHVAMEVSSHAIDLHRTDDIHFDQAIFTNLTPEHLDYHKSMELYFESKKRLFTLLLAQGNSLGRSIINAEDPYGQKLIEIIHDQPVWTYSTKAQSKWDIFPKEWHSSLAGLHGILSTPKGSAPFSSPLIGAFNLSNILAAVGAALSAGLPLNQIVKSLNDFSDVPGRLERIPNSKQLHVFVDYAHTPDALKNVLQALRQFDPPRIITLFGCGGDRDRNKRPIMGREVARFSDFAVITSDNPRTEDPEAIIREILPGVQEGGMIVGDDCLVEIDRRKAIAAALDEAHPGEVVLIAGKGHEDYQILGKQKIHFDDREITKELLGSK